MSLQDELNILKEERNVYIKVLNIETEKIYSYDLREKLKYAIENIDEKRQKIITEYYDKGLIK